MTQNRKKISAVAVSISISIVNAMCKWALKKDYF